MKNELVTAIFAAIAGFAIAFFVTNLFFGEIEDFTVPTIEGTLSTEISEPDVEVFNVDALNPTVEVYVGDDCQNVSETGECLDEQEAAQENS